MLGENVQDQPVPRLFPAVTVGPAPQPTGVVLDVSETLVRRGVTGNPGPARARDVRGPGRSSRPGNSSARSGQHSGRGSDRRVSAHSTSANVHLVLCKAHLSTALRTVQKADRVLRQGTPEARMRAHRKRRREGSFFVRVQLDPPDIDGLVRRKLLRPGQRQDPEALQVAVQGLVYQLSDGM
jgi:hypothetical protein